MRIRAIGGYEAVGRNMTSVSVGKETLLLDVGLRLDTLQLYEETTQVRNKEPEELIKAGVIPDLSLIEGEVVGVVVSHAHLDHFGALGMLKPKAEVYGTPYTIEVARREYEGGKYCPLGFGQEVEVSRSFGLRFLEITHSVPHTAVVVVETPEGTVVYANDFKFDSTSMLASFDLRGLRELGKSSVDVLIVESVNACQEGKTPGEEVARSMLKEVMEFACGEGLVVVTTFSAHIERIQAILQEAKRLGREVLVLGRSLLKHMGSAKDLGLLEIPEGVSSYSSSKSIRNALQRIERKEDYLLLATGHQGEPDSVLMRLARGDYGFKLQANDAVIFCARTIPTPINQYWRHVLEQRLKRLGVRIFKDVHVSGHASVEDHRMLLRLLNPEHVIPCHGGLELRSCYAELAQQEGYELNENLHLLTNGGFFRS